MNRSGQQFYLDQGAGEVILVLHGPFGNLYPWLDVAENLRNGYRVIIPRLPIFEGGTVIMREKLIMQLHDFIEGQQLGTITLVGASNAAYVSTLYALRYPQMVKRLIVTGSLNLTANGVRFLLNELSGEHSYNGFSG